MKHGILCAVAFSLPVICAAAPESGLLRLPGNWVPYVERMRPDDLKLLEAQLKDPFSEKSDLVFYSCDEKGKICLALAIRRDEQGDRLEMALYDPASNFPERQAVRLPSDVAERLFESIELILTRQVFPISKDPGPPGLSNSESSVIWVFLRATKTETALGKVLVPVGRCWVGVPESNRPFFEVFYRLRRCVNKAEGIPGTAVADLDIAIRSVRLSYPR